MYREIIAKQIKTETESMKNVTVLLERALVWNITGNEFSGKLASVLFIADSFHTHMERLFSLEERDGFMAVVCQICPQFTGRVSHLKETHQELRQTVQNLVLRLEHTSPTEFDSFDVICDSLQHTISWFRAHNVLESELLVEALFRDIGGRG